MVQPYRPLATLALPVAVVLLAWTPASAGPPTERLRGFFNHVNAVLTDPATEHQPLERIARVRRLVADLTDIPSAAALALGPEWAVRTPAEREEFTELFAELLERAYIGRLAGAARVTGVITLRYVDEVVGGDTATVITAVGGTAGHVEYLMTLRGGRWQVRDIVLDGVSVVHNYRAQFRRLLQQQPYAAVVTAMRTKLAGESLLFAGLPPRAPTIVSTPGPEGQAVAASPPAPVEAPPPPPPPPAPEPPVRSAARPAKAIRSALSTPAPRPATALVVASNIVVPSPARAISVPAPAPEPAETSVGVALAALLLALASLGALAYGRRRN
jgi:phospholipid transport system substrate-binding protein